MAQDLRELFEKERKRHKSEMKVGHEARFLSKLEEKIPNQAGSSKAVVKPRLFFWIRIAASVVLVLGLAIVFLLRDKNETEAPQNGLVETENTSEQQRGISLGDLSPDLKKIESYYVTNINLQLSELEFNADNKAMVDSFMERLAELDKEYGNLTEELNTIGPNDGTINALIQNLQLRLQLLQKLKSKLNQLKSSKNEQESTNII